MNRLAAVRFAVVSPKIETASCHLSLGQHPVIFIIHAGTAFLLVTTEEFPAKLENAEFFERIEKFVQVHRNSFLLLQAPVYGKREWEILSSVQNRFFGCILRVIPVHSIADVVKGMLVIVKATSKPNVVNLRDQMFLACNHIIDHSPVWGMLQEMQF